MKQGLNFSSTHLLSWAPLCSEHPGKCRRCHKPPPPTPCPLSNTEQSYLEATWSLLAGPWKSPPTSLNYSFMSIKTIVDDTFLALRVLKNVPAPHVSDPVLL